MFDNIIYWNLRLPLNVVYKSLFTNWYTIYVITSMLKTRWWFQHLLYNFNDFWIFLSITYYKSISFNGFWFILSLNKMLIFVAIHVLLFGNFWFTIIKQKLIYNRTKCKNNKIYHIYHLLVKFPRCFLLFCSLNCFTLSDILVTLNQILILFFCVRLLNYLCNLFKRRNYYTIKYKYINFWIWKF